MIFEGKSKYQPQTRREKFIIEKIFTTTHFQRHCHRFGRTPRTNAAEFCSFLYPWRKKKFVFLCQKLEKQK